MSDRVMARPLTERSVTLVWAALMAATITSTWVLSKDAFAATVAASGTLALAAWKVRFVVLDFMELRRAPWPARLLFEVWSIGVPLMILAMYLSTSNQGG